MKKIKLLFLSLLISGLSYGARIQNDNNVSASVGGNDSEIQYNNGGAFGGDSSFTFDDTTETLSVTSMTATYIQGSSITAIDQLYPLGGVVDGTLEEADISDLTHTTDTGPSPDCAGDTTYQDGEGACDDISDVYIDSSDTLDGDVSGTFTPGGATTVTVTDDSHSHSTDTISTNLIWDTNILQSGSTFYTSSGTATEFFATTATIGSGSTVIGDRGFLAPDGDISNPGISFFSDQDTGIFRIASQIKFSIDGSTAALFVNNGSGNLGIRVNGGAVNDAAITFLDDTDTGIYNPAADELSITAGGTQSLNVTTGYIRVTDGLPGEPSVSFLNATGTGLYTDGANNLNFAEDGSLVAFINQTGLGLVPDGTVSAPGIRWTSDSDTGVARMSDNVLAFVAGGSSVAATTTAALIPGADNTYSLGTASFRWSDVQSVLIQGADYGFMNGYIIREYPATDEDIQTKDEKWFKKHANKGIQFLNDKGEVIMVIGRNGTIYANSFRPLEDLNIGK